MSGARTICLLDDEPSVVRAVGRLLASRGLVTEQFTQPACFLDYARTHAVELVVLDARMPGVGGLAVQGALRLLQPNVSVIVISAEDDPALRSAALAGGAAGFFLKPLPTDSFLAAIRDVLDGVGAGSGS